MNKKNIILLVVFIGIFAMIILNRESMKRQVAHDMEKEQYRLFDSEKTSFNIIGINDLQKNEQVTFEKKGQEWFVKEKSCPADESSVNRILSSLSNIRIGQRLSEWKPDFVKEYGFDKGLEINAGGKIFMLGDNREKRIALKVDNDLYLSPFREKHVFKKHDSNWCKEVEEPEPVDKTVVIDDSDSVTE
ncbi:MAG TPA: hypothetical protein ENN58_04090 [bacterium]|nr:hypothetical protein [bacterium]